MSFPNGDNIFKYARRAVYQCSECGMLMVDDENYKKGGQKK